MLKYSPTLKTHTRALRQDMTDAEQMLWSKLRRKQIHNAQFYRQKPIGSYIVDFYASSAKLVVELDGSQHLEPAHAQRDAERDCYLKGLGLQVLRFDNLQVLKELDAVLGVIERVVGERVDADLGQNPNPPQPPFFKGGSDSLENGMGDRSTTNIPPFEKGGLGGIYGLSDSSEISETAERSK